MTNFIGFAMLAMVLGLVAVQLTRIANILEAKWKRESDHDIGKWIEVLK